MKNLDLKAQYDYVRLDAASTAVKKAVAADPKVVGYIEKSEADPSVKILLTLN
jgi:hypothetical protein